MAAAEPFLSQLPVEPDAGGLLPDGTFYPATQWIGERHSQIPTDDSKMLIVRIELPFYEYGSMERLIAGGVAALQARVDQLRVMADQIRMGEIEAPAPLNLQDVEAAWSNARREVTEATKLLDKIARPKPV
jgi:hypothetical protein